MPPATTHPATSARRTPAPSAGAALDSGIHLIDWPGRGGPGLEQWQDLASRLAGAFPDRYLANGGLRWRLPLGDAVVRSPDGVLLRHRTVDVALRRCPGRPALLDVAVGNLFCRPSDGAPVSEPTATHPAQARWIRTAGRVPLDEHVRWVRRLAADLRSLGVAIEPAPCEAVRIELPRVVDGIGERVLDVASRRRSYTDPAVPLPAGTAFGVVAATPGIAHSTADRLCDTLRALLGCDVGRVARLRQPRADAINLVLLDPALDLAADAAWRDALRDWEAQGIRFKLACTGVIDERFAALNIAADLFALAGGRPLLPACAQSPAHSLDAGHDHDADRSRWVAVESDARLGVRSVRVIDTARAEHLPPAVLDELWPTAEGGVLFRDGRLSQERDRVGRRAADERREVLEIKKLPRALLWRDSGHALLPATMAEAVVDPHGDWLVQTAPSAPQDPVHPVRLSASGGDAARLAAGLLAHHAMPGASLFHTARLPGAPGLADRVSKLTGDGWTRAIGRGLGLSRIVP